MKQSLALAIGAAMLIGARWAAGAETAIGERASEAAIKHKVPARAEGTTLRVVSFNVLYAANKQHPWAQRRAAFMQAVRDMDPDVFGVQEAEWVQMESILDDLPAYAAIGRGRDDGHRKGEIMGLFYRRGRFVLRDADTFWLSDTPEVAGSNTWGAACNRCATVAVLIDRTDGTSIGVCDTHFDHVSVPAREKSADLIRRRLPTYGAGLPWVVTGDFNSNPHSKPYETMTGEAGGIRLIDTFATVHPDAPSSTSSFHGYESQPPAGSRIDWILATRQFQPLAGGINQNPYGGVYPSDHFPVWADLKATRRE
jgi:endonuclease/exonuclease/phosphatase family metal-dependent hydrolase